ncbi:hypothetical protein HWI79_867, partial [Cryptosporidium felis]
AVEGPQDAEDRLRSALRHGSGRDPDDLPEAQQELVAEGDVEVGGAPLHEDVDQEEDEAVDVVEPGHRQVDGLPELVDAHEPPGGVRGERSEEGLVVLRDGHLREPDLEKHLPDVPGAEDRQGRELGGEAEELVQRPPGELPEVREAELGPRPGAQRQVEGLQQQGHAPGEELGQKQSELADLRGPGPEPLRPEPVHSDGVQNVDPDQHGARDLRLREAPEELRVRPQPELRGGQPETRLQHRLQHRLQGVPLRAGEPEGEGPAGGPPVAAVPEPPVRDSEDGAPEPEEGAEAGLVEELREVRREPGEVELEVLDDEVGQVVEAGPDAGRQEEAPDRALRVQVAPDVDEVGQPLALEGEVLGQDGGGRHQDGRVEPGARGEVLGDDPEEVLGEVVGEVVPAAAEPREGAPGEGDRGHLVLQREDGAEHPRVAGGVGLPDAPPSRKGERRGLGAQEGLHEGVEVLLLGTESRDGRDPGGQLRENGLPGRPHAHLLEDLREHAEVREQLRQHEVVRVERDPRPGEQPPVLEEDRPVDARDLHAREGALGRAEGPPVRRDLHPEVRTDGAPRAAGGQGGAREGEGEPPVELGEPREGDGRRRHPGRGQERLAREQGVLRVESRVVGARGHQVVQVPLADREEEPLHRAPVPDPGLGDLGGGVEAEVAAGKGLLELQGLRVAGGELLHDQSAAPEEGVHRLEAEPEVREQHLVGGLGAQPGALRDEHLADVLVEEVDQQPQTVHVLAPQVRPALRGQAPDGGDEEGAVAEGRKVLGPAQVGPDVRVQRPLRLELPSELVPVLGSLQRLPEVVGEGHDEVADGGSGDEPLAADDEDVGPLREVALAGHPRVRLQEPRPGDAPGLEGLLGGREESLLLLGAQVQEESPPVHDLAPEVLAEEPGGRGVRGDHPEDGLRGGTALGVRLERREPREQKAEGPGNQEVQLVLALRAQAQLREPQAHPEHLQQVLSEHEGEAQPPEDGVVGPERDPHLGRGVAQGHVEQLEEALEGLLEPRLAEVRGEGGPAEAQELRVLEGDRGGRHGRAERPSPRGPERQEALLELRDQVVGPELLRERDALEQEAREVLRGGPDGGGGDVGALGAEHPGDQERQVLGAEGEVQGQVVEPRNPDGGHLPGRRGVVLGHEPLNEVQEVDSGVGQRLRGVRVPAVEDLQGRQEHQVLRDLGQRRGERLALEPLDHAEVPVGRLEVGDGGSEGAHRPGLVRQEGPRDLPDGVRVYAEGVVGGELPELAEERAGVGGEPDSDEDRQQLRDAQQVPGEQGVGEAPRRPRHHRAPPDPEGLHPVDVLDGARQVRPEALRADASGGRVEPAEDQGGSEDSGQLSLGALRVEEHLPVLAGLQPEARQLLLAEGQRHRPDPPVREQLERGPDGAGGDHAELRDQRLDVRPDLLHHRERRLLPDLVAAYLLQNPPVLQREPLDLGQDLARPGGGLQSGPLVLRSRVAGVGARARKASEPPEAEAGGGVVHPGNDEGQAGVLEASVLGDVVEEVLDPDAKGGEDGVVVQVQAPGPLQDPGEELVGGRLLLEESGEEGEGRLGQVESEGAGDLPGALGGVALRQEVPDGGRDVEPPAGQGLLGGEEPLEVRAPAEHEELLEEEEALHGAGEEPKETLGQTQAGNGGYAGQDPLAVRAPLGRQGAQQGLGNDLVEERDPAELVDEVELHPRVEEPRPVGGGSAGRVQGALGVVQAQGGPVGQVPELGLRVDQELPAVRSLGREGHLAGIKARQEVGTGLLQSENGRQDPRLVAAPLIRKSRNQGVREERGAQDGPHLAEEGELGVVRESGEDSVRLLRRQEGDVGLASGVSLDPVV